MLCSTESCTRNAAHKGLCSPCYYKARYAAESPEQHARRLARVRAYAAENKAKVLADKAAYYEANRTAILADKAAYGASDRGREVRTAWRKSNPERVSELKASHYAAHREEICAKQAAYRAANPERVREALRAWAKNNPDAFRAARHTRRTRETQAGGSFTVKEWQDLCALYGHTCPACGSQGKLAADHIVPVALGGHSNIDNIQPLCKSCNSRKYTKIIRYSPLTSQAVSDTLNSSRHEDESKKE